MLGIILGIAGLVMMLTGSILMVRRKIWYPYSIYLVMLVSYLSLVFTLSFIPLPPINNLYIGLGFLIFPITDILLTRRILLKGGGEANPVVRFLLRYLKPTPTFILVFLYIFALVFFFWEKSGSSPLYALTLCYGYVIYHNIKVLRSTK